ncbi:LysR family transcriptional regulator [Candidimonas nitroreducens]|uniref:LysR family transcriptional regulator n=1 Tax=Candidimonas nitroreducens TaxID=683354 RepID=A0A225MC19_9BURK|nr:LysR family transcriptional regulator [Candidimonas nitroreducens]
MRGGVTFSINQYRYFIWVAESGSFRAAAVRACRSQPAVSLAIKDMEERLGQPLFERGTPVVPTPFGQSCLEVARRLVEHADSVATTLASLARSKGGFLGIASVSTFATHWMPQLVQMYRQSYPEIMLNVYDDNSEGVERMILRGQVELGVCSVVSNDPRLHFTPLFEDEFGLVCHRSHPLAHRPWLSWHEIADLPHIGTVAHRQLESHKAAAFLLDRPFYVSHMMSLLAMLSRNMGVTVLARLGVPPDRDDLAFVPLRRPSIRRCLGVMKAADSSLSPAARLMEELLLKEVLAPGPQP